MESNRLQQSFCKINSSLWQQHGESSQTLCHADFFNLILHAVFLVLSLSVLVIIGWSAHRRKWNLRYLHRYPLHSVQWLLMLLIFLLNLASLAEGLLTDAAYRIAISPSSTQPPPSQPHLYVPAAISLATSLVAMLTYQRTEVWRLPQLAWLLLGYWGTAVGGQVWLLLALVENNLASVEVLRFDICVLEILVYSGLAVFEANIIRKKMCCTQTEKSSLGDPPKTMKFTQKFSSFASEITFSWLNWIFKLGYQRPLEKEDLGTLPNVHSASHIHRTFKEAYKKEQVRAKAKNCKPSLWRVYKTVHGWRLFFGLILKISGDMCNFVGPLALHGIIVWVAQGDQDEDPSLRASNNQPHFITVTEFFKNGLVLVAIMFISICVRSLLLQMYEYWSTLVGIHLRSAIQTMVFEKSLHVSTFVISSGDKTMGQITNHMSTDAINVFYMMQYVIIIMLLLVSQLGTAALLSLVVFAVLVPLEVLLGNYLATQEEKALEYTDRRLKMSNEVLQGIKLLKLYGWEDLFGNNIEKIRRSEVWTIAKQMLGFAVMGSLTEAAPLSITLVSFGSLTALTGKILTPEIAFSCLSLFNLLQDPLFLLSLTMFLNISGFISTGRLAAFLAAQEVDMKGMEEIEARGAEPSIDCCQGRESNGRADDTRTYSDQDSEVQVLLAPGHRSTSHGSMGRTVVEGNSYLNSNGVVSLPDDAAIKITNGSFIWDPEGDQPTLRDLNVSFATGSLTMVVGTVGSGKSSLLSAILEEISLRSGSMQINGYRQVIEACALQADIDILPAGDMTEIGEKGINMSGGQKQRISVARVMYCDRDLILLDDPLSALDVHVGATLFTKGIVGILRKKKKTVILVTHQLQYLPQADKILLMKDGQIAEQGLFQDILAVDPELYKHYESALKRGTESDGSTDDESRRQELMRMKRQISHQMSAPGDADTKEAIYERGKLISGEELERGSVSWRVYLFYAKAVRIPVVCTILIIYPLQATLIAAGNFWLSVWSDAGLEGGDNSTDTNYYIKIYGLISMGSICNSFIITTTMAIGLLLAARRLFNVMLRNIIHMPMRFFDTTPIGRIITRFSTDTLTIDTKLAMTFDALLFYLTGIIAALVVNTYVNPIFLLIIVPLLIVYFVVQTIYITTSRELQRLNSVTKSPILAYFSETLGGLSTIRAYRKHQAFFDNLLERVTANNTAFLYLQTSFKWLGVRLDFVGALVILVAGLTTVLGALYGSISQSMVGLGISYALLISAYLQQLVRSVAEMEMQMNAVERIKHYTTLTTESYQGMEPPPHWPSKGAITIDDISVRYAPELDPVLKDVSVTIKAGERVGICGRTGSGKSSLTLALYRIIDTYQGRILIDDIDIASVPLTTLRQRLAIIPQDPVLFDGTIRMNLDPEHERTEQELWDALEIAQLKELVLQMMEGLDSQVSEGGENFSIGQRQLFCLARAFLRNAHVLIMDEATASIDIETDKILQQVVSKVFAGKTVLTIAHRVATILNSDTILTLSQGEVIEHDTPDNLLSDPDSMFASLVHNNQ